MSNFDGSSGATRQIPSGTGNTSHLLNMSNPPQAADLESVPWSERHLISAHYRTLQPQNESDEGFKKWYEKIRVPFWTQVRDSFGNNVPKYYDWQREVLAELCRSHPCTNRWEAHSVCVALLSPDRGLMKLEEWMYGTNATTHQTWRDTLSTKTPGFRKVPWVQREEILALSVILDWVEANSTGPDSTPTRTTTTVRSKRSILDRCKLTYLISAQEHVLANDYWYGFVEELWQDPDQEYLYDKVVWAKQLTAYGGGFVWPSFPALGQ